MLFNGLLLDKLEIALFHSWLLMCNEADLHSFLNCPFEGIYNIWVLAVFSLLVPTTYVMTIRISFYLVFIFIYAHRHFTHEMPYTCFSRILNSTYNYIAKGDTLHNTFIINSDLKSYFCPNAMCIKIPM
jgi:hypothetical protein